jgi:diaminopimelate epimerase
MLLRFTKMHGLGNDFMMVDLVSQRAHIYPDTIRKLADRRTGIGFDQLLTVSPPDDPNADFRYTIFNADGSEAEQCGNGARCFLRFVRDQGLTTKSFLRLQTISGQISCRLEKDGNITVNMGTPILQPARIPFIADSQQILYELEQPHSAEVTTASVVNVGNPHAVISVKDLDNAPIVSLGPIIESHERFPEKVNVGFMQILSRKQIRLRVYERGVGETQACGSGACAAIVAGRLQGLLDEHIEVELPGGKLELRWAGENTPIMMKGPARRIYEGRLKL